MTRCSRIASCPMFEQFAMRSSLAVWQAYYCEENHERCERWRRYAANQAVEANLLPNGRLLDVPLDLLDPEHLE